MTRLPIAATGPVDLDALADIERLTAVAAYNLFDPVLRTALNAICARTAAALDQPIGLVTIVLDSAQLVIGKSGLQGWIADTDSLTDLDRSPVYQAFCARAVLANCPCVVGDAINHPDQAYNPLVFDDGIRAYAGIPLRSPSGRTLGAHCVLNAEPQRFTQGDIACLEQGESHHVV